MDDFEDDELYDEDYYDQIEDDDDGESLKDKYDRAKEYKEKFDEYKEKYNNYKNKSTNNPASEIGKNAGKDVAKEGGKEAAKQGGKEVAKKGGQELAKEGAKKAGEQVVKETGKKATSEAGKKIAKEGAKIAAKEAAKKGAEGALTASGVGAPVAAAIEVADKLNEIKKKVDRKTDAAIEETTGIKNFSKKKKFIPILLIIAIIMLIFIIPAMAMYSVSETATSELTTLVRAREENNKSKKLILFTKAELKELLNNDIKISEDIAKKLADEGYTLEYDGTEYKSISYKNILKGYGSDLTNVFAPMNLTGAAEGMEDVFEDGTSYDSLSDKDKDVAVSLKNVKKYLMAEIDNFNEGVTWKKTSLNVEYLNIKGESFNNYSDYLNNSQKVVSNGSGSLVHEEITNKNYTVQDNDGKDTMLKMPKLSTHGVNVSDYGGENKAARTFVDMLEPYMQKWIIPYTMYIDTQDEDFINSVMKYMYHPADVSIFQLQKLIKTTEFQYYMVCHKYIRTETETCNDQGTCTTTVTKGQPYAKGSNTRDNPIGLELVSFTISGNTTVRQYEVTEVSQPYEIAKDSSGNPIVKKINIKRNKDKADSIPELVHLESFYEILNREYKILPINENNQADSTTPSDLSVNTGNGIGTETLVEVWNESVQMVNSETEKYHVSYYTEEQMADLGRDISRVEWYQDGIGMSTLGNYSNSSSGASSLSAENKEFIERISQYAIENAKVTGIYPSVTIAQCILESGWGRDQIAVKYGNHFGQKAFSTKGNEYWNGDRVKLNASEGGKDYFKVYKKKEPYNIDDTAFYSVMDYGRNFWITACYAQNGVLECMTKNLGPQEQLRRIAKSGYAVMRDGSITKPDGVRTYDKYLYDEFIVAYNLQQYDKDENGNNWWDGTIPAFATTSSTGSSVITGNGETLYSYDDMYFAYYQIEQWYQKSQGTLITSTIKRVTLPEGGFSWPVETSGNDGAKKVIKLYGVQNFDGILISTGNVHNYDREEGLYKGANVIATHSGTVKKVVPVSDSSTYAYIEIVTEDGKYKTHYGNLSEIKVTENASITKGQIIGKIGNTGSSSTGADIYLTYKMYYNGSKVDPLQYYYIKDSQTTGRVDNYNDIDKTTIVSGQYLFDGSRQYLAGSSEAIDGDISQGIEFYFTNSAGITFTCYLQNRGPWKTSTYGDGTIGAQGCNITSVATILTGYGYSVKPSTFSGGWAYTYGLIISRIPNSQQYWRDGRVLNGSDSGDTGGTASSSATQMIVNHLASGKPVLIHDHGDSPYAGSQHWMAMLDIREGNGSYEVFVADPNINNPDRGWRSLEKMLIDLVSFMLVDY